MTQKGLNVMFMSYYCNTGQNYNIEPATECSKNVVEWKYTKFPVNKLIFIQCGKFKLPFSS